MGRRAPLLGRRWWPSGRSVAGQPGPERSLRCAAHANFRGFFTRPLTQGWPPVGLEHGLGGSGGSLGQGRPATKQGQALQGLSLRTTPGRGRTARRDRRESRPATRRSPTGRPKRQTARPLVCRGKTGPGSRWFVWRRRGAAGDGKAVFQAPPRCTGEALETRTRCARDAEESGAFVP